MVAWNDRPGRGVGLPALVLAITLNPAGLPAASAGTRPWFEITIDPCVQVRRDPVSKQVLLELGPALRERSAMPTGAMELVVGCRGSLVVLLAHDPASTHAMENTLDLYAQPPALRERFLALAIAELLGASVRETEVHGVAPPAPRAPRETGTPPRPAAPPAARAPARAPAGRALRLRIVAVSTSQVFLTSRLVLWGGGLQVGGDGAHHLGWGLDLLARHGNASVDLGTIVVDTLSLGATLSFQKEWPRWHLRAGAGVRGGMVRLEGEPADPQAVAGDSFYGAWAGPAAALGVTFATRYLAVEAATEVGYVVLPVGGRVAGTPAPLVTGPFWGATLGVGLAP